MVPVGPPSLQVAQQIAHGRQQSNRSAEILLLDRENRRHAIAPDAWHNAVSAAINGDSRTMAWMLANGADPNVVIAGNKTALELSVERQSHATVGILHSNHRTRDIDGRARQKFSEFLTEFPGLAHHAFWQQTDILCMDISRRGPAPHAGDWLEAARFNEPDAMATLLVSGDPNTRDPNTLKTALHVAAESRSLAVAKQLAADVRTVDSRDGGNRRAFDIVNSWAIEVDPQRTNPKVAEFFNCFLTIHERCPEPQDAVRIGDLRLLESIIAIGTDPNYQVSGQTPLHLVAELTANGHLPLHLARQMAEYLKQDLRTNDLRDRNNQRAFDIVDYWASRADPTGTNQQVREFFECFTTIRDRRLEPQDAVRHRDAAMLATMLAAGDDPNFRDPATGRTALHLVAESVSIEMASILAADPRTRDLPDRNNQLAWHIANASALRVDPQRTNPGIRQFHGYFVAIRNRSVSSNQPAVPQQPAGVQHP
jgi:ankyrin repeat protein